MDKNIFFAINQGMQNSFFDLIMPFITSNAEMLFFIIVLPFALKERKKSLFVILLCIIALVIGDAVSNMFKHLIERPRPCHSLEDIRLSVGCGGSFSMPSSHAVNAFSTAATFAYFFKKSAIPMFVFASLVAFSRVYVGVHYPSDVLAGIVLGGITAGIVILFNKWASKKLKKDPASIPTE